MSSFTPGPWSFSTRDFRNVEDPSGCIYITGDPVETEGEEHGYCTGIAKVYGNMTSGTIAADNARLMCAAPNLLEACEAALPAIRWAETHTIGNAVQFQEVTNLLLTVIAKARGIAS